MDINIVVQVFIMTEFETESHQSRYVVRVHEPKATDNIRDVAQLGDRDKASRSIMSYFKAEEPMDFAQVLHLEG